MDISVVSTIARLDALQAKAGTAPTSSDAELQSQLARFMCVLASGLLEQAVISILGTYIQQRSQARVQHFALHQLSRLQNAKFEDILVLLGRFDPAWRVHIEGNTTEDIKSAIDSIVNNRNQIAHGKQVNISLSTFAQYYVKAKTFLTQLEGFLVSQ